MGYTHSYRTPKKLGTEQQFEVFANDCKKIFDYCQNELGIKLAGGFGEGEPVANNKEIWFNGSDEQPIGVWTTNEDIVIPFPSSEASLHGENPDPIASKTAGNWYAGTLVSQRVAPTDNETGLGSGSYETLSIVRVHNENDFKDGSKYFDCCKTAYRPYDLTVTAVLIALKHHFPAVEVSSDGKEKDWLDGRILCNNILGYGMETVIDD